MISLALIGTSFLAGILTVLAPCVLPLLPVIVGGSLIAENKWRPLIITASLGVSIILFTLLLKVSTLFINIPQDTWKYLSGAILVFFGFVTLFPTLWDRINGKLKLSAKTEGTLITTKEKKSLGGTIILGAALGPVFSSCSPTYFVILATVLPVSFAVGIFYLIIYTLGVAISLLAICYLGRKLTSHLKFALNPEGWFKRIIAILLILVGLMIITGIDKKIEIAILDAGFGVTTLEQNLLKDIKTSDSPLTSSTPTNTEPKDQSGLPIIADAPEFVGLTNWINTDKDLTLGDLKGKVVLVDFWTYSCINCLHTLPYIQKWHESYADKGLVVIGVHAPEFKFEYVLENVKKAVKDLGLTYPIVQDNDFSTWRAYDNHYWPAKYLIDQDGKLRYYHYGEGKYEETEQYIVDLLGIAKAEEKTEVITKENSANSYNPSITHETYLGLNRRTNFIQDAQTLKTNQWTLQGQWKEEGEKITTAGNDSSLRMKFIAARANLVLSGEGQAEVYIDGKLLTQKTGTDVKDGLIQIGKSRLYQLTDFASDYSEKEIEIKFKNKDIALYAWTFD